MTSISTGRTFTSTTGSIKFLCSYGGKILPRPSDCRLRYVGGVTRVFSVDCSTSYSELMKKLGELCGYDVTLRCQLPSEDLDVLVSIKSEEDLVNVIEVYQQASVTSARDMKIRAILSPVISSSVKQRRVSSSPSFSSLTTMLSSSRDSLSIQRTSSGESSPSKSMRRSHLSGESSPRRSVPVSRDYHQQYHHYQLQQLQQQRSYYSPVKPAVVPRGQVARSPVCSSRVEAVRDCYRPCHLQANSKLAHLFPQRSNNINRGN